MNNRLLHTPEGVRDIYGKEYARKLAVEQKLQNAIHCFGYEDIQTPSIEFFDVFSKEIGTTPSKELYKFFDKEGNTLVLRPDFTPSIARCAAKYFMEEKVPLRFSYNGNTFTNTSNLQGKLKEVTQMGAEFIGDPSVEADAEVISMVIEALKSTGLTRFQVTIGEVDYFRGLCEEAGLDEDTEKELRSYISGKNFFAAQELLEQEPERLEDRVMLLWGRDWHPGVIGIVASRLVEKTGRPVIVVSIDEHGEGKGSGRSVQGFNLHACIASCEDLLLRFGGHAMAAGLSVREENLPELRRRLNEWAARECPVLVAPPLECDLSIHLDRITVESVRRLDQLAPYGAENPAPVFLLEKAVVEGVYPVSEGRHCRLRLRQGNACIYAVWFGMHPEQLPYATGDVVDAALSLSVYEAARGAQLSGRILELHPAGFGNAAAQQTALVQALRRGSPLTAQQRALIAPERSDIITVYRELQARRWHAEDMQPLFAKLGEEHTGKTLVALTALEQVGLIAAVERGGAKFWELVPTAGKKNLADAPILKCLEE